MAQENDAAEVNAKFSTLNVNAMEFVPSFASAPDRPVDEDPPVAAVATPTDALSDKTPDNNGMLYFSLQN